MNSIWKPPSPKGHETCLLVLQPASDAGEEIVGDFEIVNLDEDHHYEAISYCWGTCPLTVTTTIAGQKHEMALNLADAILKLQTDQAPRKLWADALCISQTDLDEKAAQVSMMSLIYTRAAAVHVWLGQRDLDGSHMRPDVWHMIEEVSRDPAQHFQEFPFDLVTEFSSNWWNRMWTVQEALLARHLTFIHRAGSFSLEQLRVFARATFGHLVTWPGCCRHLSFEQPLPQLGFLAIGLFSIGAMIERRRELKTKKFDLLELTLDHGHRRASNARDLLFALLGTANDVPQDFVTYQESLSDTYAHCASMLMTQTQTLDVLNHVEIASLSKKDQGLQGSSYEQRGTRDPWARMPELPTWCPDWSQRLSPARLESLRFQYSLRKLYSASGNSRAIAAMYTKRSLRLSGLIINTISLVGEPFDNDWRAPDGWQVRCDVFRQWYLIIASLIGIKVEGLHGSNRKTVLSLAPFLRRDYPQVAGDTMLDAFRRTLLGDRHSSELRSTYSGVRLGAVGVNDRVLFMQCWSNWISGEDEGVLYGSLQEHAAYAGYIGALEGDSNDKSKTTQLMNGLEDWMTGFGDRKRLIVSSQGYIGLGPATAQAGDVISILHGGKTPFILRKIGTGEGCNRAGSQHDSEFVGGAYVHGLMSGEAIRMEERKELQSQIFILH